MRWRNLCEKEWLSDSEALPQGILYVPVDGVEVVDDGGATGVAVRAQVAARLKQLVLHVLLGNLADLPLDLLRLGLG